MAGLVFALGFSIGMTPFVLIGLMVFAFALI